MCEISNLVISQYDRLLKNVRVLINFHSTPLTSQPITHKKTNKSEA
jgi:hypothetical protein